jgi:putative endonuclease
MAYMYILQCSDKSLYVGSTINLEARIWQHNEGEGAVYTQTRRPVMLLYFEMYDRVEDAFRREKQVQNWSRAKRLALVREQPELLPGLSKKKFSSGRGSEGSEQPRAVPG